MQTNSLLMAASVLAVGLACGCAVDPGSDSQENVGVSKVVLVNPVGYNPPGFDPFNPLLNLPGYNAPGVGLGMGYDMNPPGYNNPPGYDPSNPVANPPGYNPPGM